MKIHDVPARGYDEQISRLAAKLKGGGQSQSRPPISRNLLTITLFLALFILGCSLLIGVSDESDAATSFDKDGIRYLPTSATTVQLTNYIGSSDVVIIPSTVTDDSTSTTYDVTSIKPSAFTGQSGITKVTIGDKVTSIGSGAFYNCTNLTTVTIGSSVVEINFNAFQNCKALTSITIPNTVTSLGSSVFQGCEALTEVGFGVDSRLATIGTYTFSGCKLLASIHIPNSVSTIGQNAFQGCEVLNNVVIGNSVTSLPNYLFKGCSGLKNLTIGKSVGTIGYNVFDGCSGIKMTILCSVGSGMFSSQTYIKEIIIEEGVSSVANTAFQYCTSLESVTIKSSTITSIGKHTFLGCTSLKTISIPNSIVTIGEQAFYGCGKLTTVTDMTNVSTIENGAFQKCEKLVITIPTSISAIGKKAFEECKGLTSVTISGTVGTIEEDAFRECTELMTLIIGGSVSTIGESAFYNCTSLETVALQSSVNIIGKFAFYNCTSIKTITFPSTVTDIKEYAFNGITFYNTGSTNPLGQTADNLKGSTFKRSESAPTEPKLYRVGSSDTQIIEGVIYKLITPTSGGKYVSVVGYDVDTFPSDGDVTIESQVTFDGVTYNVIMISTNAFKDCNRLTSVTIPVTVMTIDEEAFVTCNSLKSVTIGERVKNINYAAFYQCSNITYISFPNSLEFVGDMAFGSLEFYDGETLLLDTAQNLKGSVFRGSDGKLVKDGSSPTPTTTYTIRFVNYDGTVLKTYYLAYGLTPRYDGETPTRPDDEQYTYTFKGWDPKVTAVTGDATYTATYDAIPITDPDAGGETKSKTKGLDANGQFLLVTFGAIISLTALALIITRKRP